MDIKYSDQHDGGGFFCMCDVCKEVRKRYFGFDADEFERIVSEQKLKEVEKELSGKSIRA